MRIAIINSHPKYLLGGAELFMYYCTKEFLKKTHEVHMISVYPKSTSPIPEPPITEICEGIHIHHLPNVATNTLSALRFLCCLSKIHTDVYLKMFTEPSTVLLAAYAKLRGIPYVLFMAHDNHCQKDAGISVAARYSVSRHVRWLMVNAGLYRWSLRGARRILVQNERQKTLLLKNFGIHASDIIKIGHPLPSIMIKKERSFRIIWNARFVSWKRPELFIDIAKQLPEYQFVMGGPLPNEADSTYFKHILLEIQKVPNIQVQPFPETFEKFLDFPLYVGATLFVDTVEQGGFENTLVQSWLRGVPVISVSRAFEGSLEANGLGVYCHNSTQEAVKNIKYLLTHPDEMDNLSQQSYTYANKEYDIQPIALKILTHLEAVSGRK